MNKSPEITMTRLDIQRLDKVLASLDAPINLLEALEGEILRAKVVSHDHVAADVVTMNSTVRFIDEASGREFILTLVYPEQAGKPGSISVLAPVGIALLGLKVGQSIDWRGPSGRPLKLKIIDILYQPEANGDYHL
ncbi:nucleoside diphosphate kinase regulator [Pseudomonas sp. WN033]|nr:nucleoside diphosphate kinase regulator [Pseudomonas sp. WN033]